MVFTLEEICEHADELSSSAKREHELRRMREAYIATSHFGEPVWDILLDLFAATLREEEVQTTAITMAGHSPPTTALRYLDTLVEEGMILRSKKEGDARVNLIRLSDEAICAVGSYFMAVAGYEPEGRKSGKPA